MKRISLLAINLFLISPAFADSPPATQNPPPATQAPTTADLQESLQQSRQQFKEWFNTDIQSDEQLGNYAMKLIADYYAKQKNCVAGTYKYPVLSVLAGHRDNEGKLEPMFYLGEAKIHGMQDGKCAVDISVGYNDKTQFTKCNYSTASLNYYTPEKAELAIENRVGYNDSAFPTIKKECKLLPTEQEKEAKKSLTSFLENLKQCTPGTYVIKKADSVQSPISPAPVEYSIRTTIISGYQNNKCAISSTLISHGNKIQENCTYSPEVINFVIQNTLDELNHTNLARFSANQAHAMLTEILDECGSTNTPF
jgi:hypothetical protein